MRCAIAAAGLALLAAHGIAARTAVRGFVPTVGNGAGSLLPPTGASGCGYDLASCFPAAFAAVSDVLVQLQAAYSIPGGIPPGLDALAPFSAAAAAKLARGWAAAGDAGRDVDGLADAIAEVARRDAAPWAQAAGAAGAVAIGTAIDVKAAEAHAADALAAAQRVSDTAAALAAAAAHP